MRPRTRLLTTASVVALAVAGCGADDENGRPGKAKTATKATSTTPPPKAKPQCKKVRAPKPTTPPKVTAPKDTLDAGKVTTAVLTTNCGSFTITLDVKRAPKTASSFAALARAGFYDGLGFHRIVPGFVVQGGDPDGTGQGGPGYDVVEAPPADLAYTKGVVAMAKTEIEDPGTSGSQFFVVTGADVGLPPDYALVGKVTAGLDIVETIGAEETNQAAADPALRDRPIDPVVIQRVTITTAEPKKSKKK